MNEEKQKAIKIEIVNSLKEWCKIHSIVKDRCHAKLTYNEVYLLLDLIKKLKKENEELKIVKSAIQTLQINSMEDEKYIVISKNSFLDGSYKHLLDDYISKQEVNEYKKEIEQLHEQIDKMNSFMNEKILEESEVSYENTEENQKKE